MKLLYSTKSESINHSVCLPVCLSACLPVFLSDCLSVCLLYSLGESRRWIHNIFEMGNG